MAETQDWVDARTLVLASVTPSPGGHLQTADPCQGTDTEGGSSAVPSSIEGRKLPQMAQGKNSPKPQLIIRWFQTTACI